MGWLSPIRRCFLSLCSKITNKSLGLFWRHCSYCVSDSLIRRLSKMNCPHRINGPLNAAGVFCHCKRGGKRGQQKNKNKTAYNKYSVHAAEVLGFITGVEGKIDGIFLKCQCHKNVWVLGFEVPRGACLWSSRCFQQQNGPFWLKPGWD